MARTKRTEGPALTKAEHAAREAVRQDHEPPEPQSPPDSRSPPGSVEDADSGARIPHAEWLRLTVEQRRERAEAQLIPSPKDHDDGVVAEYNMYINAPTKKILIIQYPNRDPGQPYSDKTGQKPLELRIKPKCGLVEVDIPMDIHSNFDKEKGIIYGEAMRKSRVLQEGGSYGMAGGLGIGAKPRPASSGDQASTAEEPDHESLLVNFDDANDKGHVMNKITLGGTIVPFKPGNDPNYYIGVFKSENLYLNKVDAMVQLRPQFGHLDALADFEKPARAHRAAETGEEESEAKAVNMTAKSTEAEDSEMYGGVGETLKLLKAMREEPWQRMEWVDEEDQQAYATYEDQFFPAPGQDLPDLISTMTNEQWLDAMSAPRIDPTNPGKRHMSMPKRDDAETTDTGGDEETDEDGSNWEMNDEAGEDGQDGQDNEEVALSEDKADGE